MVCSLAAVAAVYYAVQATANDGNLLDLDNIELSQSSTCLLYTSCRASATAERFNPVSTP